MASKAAFTPGPWKVTKAIDRHTEEDNDFPGAEISWTEDDPDGQRYPHNAAVQIWSERATADARLIAASPEMYDLLCRLVRPVEPDDKLIWDAKSLLARIDGGE